MSEYLSKKAVLEWLHQKREAFLNSGFLFEMEAVEQVIAEIQSGAFDADDSEIQRLRAELERIKKWYEDPEPVTIYKIWNLANKTPKGDETR